MNFTTKLKSLRRLFVRSAENKGGLFLGTKESFYKRRCDLSGKEIFSMFSKDAPVKVYDRDIWWSDKWDPMGYGRDYDFSRPFFEQYHELIKEVPWFSRSVLNMVNSDYCMNCGDLKNCYLVFHAGPAEDCMYGNGINNSNDCVDNAYTDKCELCYGCFVINNCYKAFFSSNCDNSQEIYFCHDCVGCNNCFGCVNLRNKQYHIFNKPYSKEDYYKKLGEFNLNSHKSLDELAKQTRDFWIKSPVKFITGRHNSNITGDYIFNSKNTFDSFRVSNIEDSRYIYGAYHLSGTKDCYDYDIWGENVELIYESNQVGKGASRLKSCLMCYPSARDLEYCMMCGSSSNLFGCAGLRNKQYCILNKQYSKEEYEELLPKIIEHMNSMPYTDKKGRIYKYGEFFPPELSPFAYNETIAQEYFPLSAEAAVKAGYSWRDPEERNLEPEIHYNDLSDQIKDVKDDIVGKLILCKAWDEDSEKASQHNCTKVFKIIPQELEFYKKMNLPIPRFCPNTRHFHRIKQRNPLKLWHRKCQCAGEKSDNEVYKNTIEHFHKTNHCPNEFETTYSPERKEIVYCEQCYLAEVA